MSELNGNIIVDDLSDVNSDYDKEQQFIQNNLPVSSIPVGDKGILQNDTETLMQHNTEYTNLLQNYVTYNKKNLEFKSEKKMELYEISKNILIALPFLTFFIVFICIEAVCKNPLLTIDKFIPELITATISLISSYLVILKMITSYLFNKSEEESMATIIGNIQTYDKEVRQNSFEDQ